MKLDFFCDNAVNQCMVIDTPSSLFDVVISDIGIASIAVSILEYDRGSVERAGAWACLQDEGNVPRRAQIYSNISATKTQSMVAYNTPPVEICRFYVYLCI